MSGLAMRSARRSAVRLARACPCAALQAPAPAVRAYHGPRPAQELELGQSDAVSPPSYALFS